MHAFLDEFHDEWYNWEGLVESLKNISQRDKYYLAQIGTLVPENPMEADLDKVHGMMIYCFASYLLGANGEKVTFGFNTIYSNDGSRGYYPEFDVSLGSPVNEYYSAGSVYTRDCMHAAPPAIAILGFKSSTYICVGSCLQ